MAFRKLRIWSHLQKKSLMENFNFYAVENKSFKSKYFAILLMFKIYFVEIQKQPPKGVHRKRCSENMQQI